jgi:hypothetical protein
MVFSSAVFLVYFLPLVLLTYFLAAKRYRNAVLSIYDLGIRDSCFSKVDFWYYNREKTANFDEGLVNLDGADRYTAARRYDIVMIIATDPNVGQVGWGFLEQATNRQADKGPRAERIAEFEAQIRANREWLQNVRMKAKENNVPLDTMIRRDAIFMVDNP